MLHCDLSQKEQHRMKEIAEHTRQMLLTGELPIDSQDDFDHGPGIGIITCRSRFPSFTR